MLDHALVIAAQPRALATELRDLTAPASRRHIQDVVTKTHQTQKCENSVPPDVPAALVRANAPHLIEGSH
ncbi:MAG: hypothetical protein ABJH45_02820 [Paracoccaceae bacterium]|uniref:hypothetical protein n=1 Tax=Roseobacter sp. TaxID=1907202 RepID=UPI00329862D2